MDEIINKYRSLGKDWEDFYNDFKDDKTVDIEKCREKFFEDALFESYLVTDDALEKVIDELNVSLR